MNVMEPPAAAKGGAQTDPRELMAFNAVADALRDQFGAAWSVAPANIMAEAGAISLEVHVSRSRYDWAVEFCSKLACDVNREFGYRYALLVLPEDDAPADDDLDVPTYT